MTLRPAQRRVETSWNCPSCGMDVDIRARWCNLCQRGKPQSKQGAGQIFEGKVIHFNGVIPRTLAHPSHSVEWRMAERHGAVVLEELDMDRVTHLIFRPGYERSDKVRRSFNYQKAKIWCVPIVWLLDSLLQSRPIHESMVALRLIPSQPLGGNNAARAGAGLPHHGHPFYVAASEDYELFTKVERQKQQEQLMEKRQAQIDAQGGGANGAQSAGGDGASRAVAAKGNSASSGGDATVKGNVPAFPRAPILKNRAPVLSAIQGGNKVLFHNMTFTFSPDCLQTTDFVKAATQRGVTRIVESPRTDGVTHLIYANSDKKHPFVFDALDLLQEEKLIFVTLQWFEDCVLLNEVVPPMGPYVPTAKLLQTMGKKRAKAASPAAA